MNKFFKGSMWLMSIKALNSLRRKTSGRLTKWEEKPKKTRHIDDVVKELKSMMGEIDTVIKEKTDELGQSK